MRTKLEPWEIGILCELWHRVEVNILDDRPRTQMHLLRQVGRELRDMQLQYKPKAEPGNSSRPLTSPDRSIEFEFSKRVQRWKGSSPGR